jgi:hypothetical protein
MLRWASCAVVVLLLLGQACALESSGRSNTIDAGSPFADAGNDSGVGIQAAPAQGSWPTRQDPWATANESPQDTRDESGTAE